MKQKGFAPILIVLLITVITALGGFLLYNTKTKPIPPSLKQIFQSSPASNLLNRKAFQNDYISFTYPPDWIIENSESSIIELGRTVLIKKPSLEISFIVRNKPEKPDFFESYNFENREEIIIDGIKGMKATGYSGEAGTVYKTLIQIYKDNIEYDIIANNYNGTDIKDLNEIISTLKLLNIPQPDINSWKTYINSKDGYSIKYPDTWYVFAEKDNLNKIAGLLPDDTGDILITSLDHFPMMSVHNSESYIGLEIKSVSSRYMIDKGLVEYLAEIQNSPILPSNVTELNINGNNVFREIDSDGDLIYHIPFPDKNKRGWIEAVILSTTMKTPRRIITEQILSTFQFTK